MNLTTRVLGAALVEGMLNDEALRARIARRLEMPETELLTACRDIARKYSEQQELQHHLRMVSDPSVQCPVCASRKVMGLMGSFWVGLDADGNMIGEWADMAGNTEVGTERMCDGCNSEWEI